MSDRLTRTEGKIPISNKVDGGGGVREAKGLCVGGCVGWERVRVGARTETDAVEPHTPQLNGRDDGRHRRVCGKEGGGFAEQGVLGTHTAPRMKGDAPETTTDSLGRGGSGVSLIQRLYINLLGIFYSRPCE